MEPSGKTSKIDDVVWYDGAKAGEYDVSFADDAFKWNLVRRNGRLVLMAMPRDAGLDFHPELLDAVMAAKGWRREELEVLGGGTRFPDGEIVHKSTHFGRMPEAFRAETLRRLGLKG